MFYNDIMYNHNILSSAVFGSIFLFSTSLILTTNSALLEDKQIQNRLFIINGLTMIVSGSIMVYYNLVN